MGLFDGYFDPRQFGEGGGLLDRLLALLQQQGQYHPSAGIDEEAPTSRALQSGQCCCKGCQGRDRHCGSKQPRQIRHRNTKRYSQFSGPATTRSCCGARRMKPRARGRSWRHAINRQRRKHKHARLRKLKAMKQTPTPPLEDRIRQIRADIDAIIDARAETVAKQSPGVPLAVIRNLLTARAPACACAQYLELSRDGRPLGPPFSSSGDEQ